VCYVFNLLHILELNVSDNTLQKGELEVSLYVKVGANFLR
jgi:hypothetical protein